MSYAICRVQKIKGASSVRGIQGHQRREWESKSNPDIDYSRKNLNYALIEDRSKNFNDLADERIRQGYTGKTAIRKDAVKVVSALFTSDNEFFNGKTPEVQRNFFADCLKWADKRFGKGNIFSAVVHMDEATPHMHVEFVPLTSDGRLSAKAVLGGRMELQRLQDDFFKSVGKPWGLNRGERADLEDPTAPKPRKHLETADLKRRTATEIEKSIEDLEKQENEHINSERALRAEKDRLLDEIHNLEAKKDGLASDIAENQKSLNAKISALNKKLKTLENKLEEKNVEYDVAVSQLKDVLDKKARAAEIRTFDPFGKRETQTYHVNILESTRAIGYEAYRDLQKAKEKLEAAQKAKKQIEQKESEVNPMHKQAKEELEKAHELRKNQEFYIKQQAEAIAGKKISEAFKHNYNRRNQRLEAFCEEIKFKDGQSVLDIFEEKEIALKEQITRNFDRGQSR